MAEGSTDLVSSRIRELVECGEVVPRAAYLDELWESFAEFSKYNHLLRDLNKLVENRQSMLLIHDRGRAS
jgi:hypothetical protein